MSVGTKLLSAVDFRHPAFHLRRMAHLEEAVLNKERNQMFSGSLLHARKDQGNTEHQYSAQHCREREELILIPFYEFTKPFSITQPSF